MGLFNTGKNDKVEKVSKYERHYNVPEEQKQSSRRRSSKPRSHPPEHPIRAISQPPLMRFPQPNGINPQMYQGIVPFNGNIRYPIVPYDLSKYSSANPYLNQMQMNIQPYWNNQIPFQQIPYQQTPWPNQSNYPFLQF